MVHGILVTYSSTMSEAERSEVPEDVHSGLQATNLFFQCHGTCDGFTCRSTCDFWCGYYSKGLGYVHASKSLPKNISCVSLESTQDKTMIRSHVLNLRSFASFCVHLRSLGNFFASRLQQELGRRKPKNLLESTIRAQDMILYITKSRFAWPKIDLEQAWTNNVTQICTSRWRFLDVNCIRINGWELCNIW